MANGSRGVKMIQIQEETDLSEHFEKWLQVKLIGMAELLVQQK